MLGSSSPIGFKQYLDRISTKRRAPNCIISHYEGMMPGLDVRPASAHLEPGCYKTDRDVVLDSRREVKKGTLTDSYSAPSFTFGSTFEYTARLDSRGSAESDSTPDRAWLHSAPAWSMPHKAAEARPRSGPAPGPGSYEADSHFDRISRSRQQGFDRLVRRTKPCHWDQDFAIIFRSMHASATQTRHMKTAAG